MLLLIFRLLLILATLLSSAFVGLPLFAQSSPAIELRLAGEITTTSGIIRLGDLVDISGTEFDHWQSLAKMELFPAPNSPTRVHARDVLERLSLRGVPVDRIRLTGHESILIRPATTARPDRLVEPPVQLASREVASGTDASHRGSERIEQLLIDHLRRKASAEANWKLDVSLAPADAQLAGRATGPFHVSGFAAPWAGTHEVNLRMNLDGQPIEIAVRVAVTSDTYVVVLDRAVQRGDVIQASHLRLVPLTERTGTRDLVYRTEDVIGTAAKRNIGGGELVQSSWFERPRVVRRGDLVKVIAQRGGVRVETHGVAQQDGAVHDVIAVEAENPKRNYHAVVIGPGRTSLSQLNSHSATVRR